MIAVERLQHDALISSVQQRQQGSVHSAGCAARHKHLRVRIHAETVEAVKLLRNSLTQNSDTVHARVNIVAGTDRV